MPNTQATGSLYYLGVDGGDTAGTPTRVDKFARNLYLGWIEGLDISLVGQGCCRAICRCEAITRVWRGDLR